MFKMVLNLFNRSARTPEEAVEVAETAERSLEDRLKAIKTKLAAGGYARLSTGEMESFIEDLDKVLTFLESAFQVIENAKLDTVVEVSLRRLRYIRTRIRKLQTEQAQLKSSKAASA
jgi:hypothetical protein